ncbi:TMhelix containing protein [Vibrio phage 1.191.O._10N.286.52.B4]|nr:TMhelix containing protein [Vibrio phage 1.191.O._10N.286.52.B4]
MDSKIPTAILGVGMALAAGYLEVNGASAGALWLGVFICFVSVV